MSLSKKSEQIKAQALFLTNSGVYVDLLDVDPDNIYIQDIAHGLSNCCRYNGQVSEFYSVAEHCYLLAEYARNTLGDDKLARYLLLHDASEAYVGDVVYHLKPFLKGFVEIEQKILNTVYTKYGLTNVSEEIKKKAHELDRRICVNEMHRLMPDSDPNFEVHKIDRLDICGLDFGQKMMTPQEAKDAFLDMFMQLF